MNPFAREKKRLLEIAIIALLVVAVLVGFFTAEEHVTNQAEKRARVLMVEISAVQNYLEQSLPRAIAAQATGPEAPDSNQLTFSRVMSRLVELYNEKMTKQDLPPIRLRIAHRDTPDPAQKADPFEQSLIDQFRQNRHQAPYREIRRIHLERFLYYAVPFSQFLTAGTPTRVPGEPGHILCEPPNLRPTEEQTGPVAGLIAVLVPVENDFKFTSVILWCSTAAAVVIALLLYINFQLDARVRHSQAQLRQSRLERDLAGELGRLGIWTLHLNDMTFTLTPEAAALLGRPHLARAHPTVEYMMQFIHPQDRQDIRRTIEAITKGQSETGTFVYRLRTDDIHYHTFSLLSRVFTDENGHRHLVGTLIDITEQAHIRRERDSLLQNLAARNQELEQYAYSISHDLKSPLVTVEGFIQLLKKALKEQNPADIENAVMRIGNSTRKLKELIDNLLTLSKLGHIADCDTDVDLNQVVSEALELNDAGIHRIGAQVTVEPLPVVRGDASRLLQVFHNLIDNAIKFSYDQPHPRIRIGCQENRSHGPLSRGGQNRPRGGR